MTIGSGIADAAYGVCSPRRASIIAQTGNTYIYRSGREPDERIFACSKRFPGRTPIGYGGMDVYDNLVVKGSYLAFTHTEFLYTEGLDPTSVEAVNLRLHRHSEKAEQTDTTPLSLELCAINIGANNCLFSPGELHLTRRGSIAFEAHAYPRLEECPDEGSCEAPPGKIGIYRFQFSANFKRQDLRVLDNIMSRDEGSLRVTGGRMRWTGNGQTRTASIR